MKTNVTGVFDADIGAGTMAWRIRDRVPFFFVRIGDGAIECILGRGRAEHTCDHERYSPALAKDLVDAIGHLRFRQHAVLWGDWRTATRGSIPTYVEEWVRLVDADNRLRVDYESLLLMRESPALVNFYRDVRNDPRSKCYIGRDAVVAIPLLQCRSAILTDMKEKVDISRIRRELNAFAPEVILFGAGMGGLVAVVDYYAAHPETTCIHLGSALDPLFGHRSRAGQLSQERATKLMEGIL